MRDSDTMHAHTDERCATQAPGSRAGQVGSRVVALARLAAALHMAQAARDALTDPDTPLRAAEGMNR